MCSWIFFFPVFLNVLKTQHGISVWFLTVFTVCPVPFWSLNIQDTVNVNVKEDLSTISLRDKHQNLFLRLLTALPYSVVSVSFSSAKISTVNSWRSLIVDLYSFRKFPHLKQYRKCNTFSVITVNSGTLCFGKLIIYRWFCLIYIYIYIFVNSYPYIFLRNINVLNL